MRWVEKLLSVLITIAVIAVMTFAAATPVNAQLTEVWVDDDWAGSTNGDPVDGHTFGTNAFAGIQDGIDAVTENGLVYVFSGEYFEEITINKTINLTGDDKTNTIITGSTTLESGEYPIHKSTVVFVAAKYVNISGFTIKGGHAGIRVGLGCDYINISGNIFTNVDGRDIELGSSSHSIPPIRYSINYVQMLLLPSQQIN